PAGAVRFARLVQVAENIKCELTTSDRAERYVPRLLAEDGRALELEVSVERAALNRLIKDKGDRTIDCCHEALARARERCGLRLWKAGRWACVRWSAGWSRKRFSTHMRPSFRRWSWPPRQTTPSSGPCAMVPVRSWPAWSRRCATRAPAGRSGRRCCRRSSSP